jgi:AraC-like DNA-binding protein/CheY-like chemotaxis protein
MIALDDRRRERYELVVAAHRLVLGVLPFRPAESRNALDAFVAAASACTLPRPDVEAVLIETLVILNPHTGGRLPSLVDRFLAGRNTMEHPLDRFQTAVHDVIRYRGVGDGDVQRAIAIVHARFAESDLTAAKIAAELSLSAHELSRRFAAATDVSCTQYLRDVRLDAAATRLATTGARVKEIWAGVGFNDGSNFDHWFIERFGVSPREHRARALRSATVTGPADGRLADFSDAVVEKATRSTLLIVDDDLGTRDTLSRVLAPKGFVIQVAASGKEGLACIARAMPDVALLDFHLGDMDGLECLREIRRRRADLRPPAVIFSGDWEIDEHAREIRTLGGCILSKLCDLEQLERTIESMRLLGETLRPMHQAVTPAAVNTPSSQRPARRRARPRRTRPQKAPKRTTSRSREK